MELLFTTAEVLETVRGRVGSLTANSKASLRPVGNLRRGSRRGSDNVDDVHLIEDCEDGGVTAS